MAYLNTASLVKQIDDLRIFMQSEDLDLLAINESRLDLQVPDSLVMIKGYNIIRRDRKRHV